jgi:dihydroorotase
LAVGADADVVIIDSQAQWEVDPGKFRSKRRNTPFAGWKVKGLVLATFVGSRQVFEAPVTA